MSQIITVKVAQKGIELKDFEDGNLRRPVDINTIIGFSVLGKGGHGGVLDENWMLVVESEVKKNAGLGFCESEFDILMQTGAFEKK